MSQGNLFAAEVTHYGPTPTAGLPVRLRAALCGVTYSLGGLDPGHPALGSSNLENVNCVACLDVVEARRRIAEAGE